MFELLLAYAVLLQFGDFWTTKTILGAGGRELNPIMAALLGRLGVVGGLAVKVLVASAMAVILYLYSSIGLIAFALLYTGVVGWNIYQMKK